MSHPRPTELLAALPAETAAALAPLLADPGRSVATLRAAFATALRATDYPHVECGIGALMSTLTDARPRGVMPLPETLTPVQRALAELLAYEDDVSPFFEAPEVRLFCMPETAANRRRWLGLDPGGPIEAPIDTIIDGVERRVPIWYAAQSGLYRSGWRGFLMQLPMRGRLEVIGALHPPAYGIASPGAMPPGMSPFDELRDEGRDWAPACADRLLALDDPRAAATLQVRLVVFLALARAQVPIEPRWHAMFPLFAKPVFAPVMRECLAAIPVARREAALLAALGDSVMVETQWGVRALLDDVPSRRLAERLFALTHPSGMPSLLVLLDELGVRHAQLRDVAATVRAARAPGAIELTCARGVRPRSVDALTEVQQRQVCAFGRAYDGADRPAAARLAPGVGVEDGSFAGELEIVAICDADQAVRYEAYLITDSGSVFEAGTTREVAGIAQGALDGCRDPALHAALTRALGTRPRG